MRSITPPPLSQLIVDAYEFSIGIHDEVIVGLQQLVHLATEPSLVSPLHDVQLLQRQKRGLLPWQLCAATKAQSGRWQGDVGHPEEKGGI